MMSKNTLCVAILAVSIAVLGALPGAPAALADTTLTVGKAAANADPIIPVNIGNKVGIFQKHGLDIKIVDFAGGSKMAQAMAAGAIDIGDGAGTELAFAAKGAPMLGICQTASTFPFLGIGVPANSPIESIADLKGKKMGISSPGSLTDWLTRQLSAKEGWGPDGMTTVAIGNAVAGIVAAFRADQVDADMGEAALFLNMEENKIGRLLVPVSDFQGSAASGTLFASKNLMASHPNAIRAFLVAWLETLDYIRTHKAETVKMKAEMRGYSETVEAKDYDLTLGMYTKTCKFDAEALATLKRTFVDLKLLDTPPDMSKLITDAYLPK
jgi:ABC-type nitrate/sulfonate/bicarbonate transport system substrate-binding protein